MIWIIAVWAGIFMDAFGVSSGRIVAAAGAAAAVAAGLIGGRRNER
jgi:hypothetical protein